MSIKPLNDPTTTEPDHIFFKAIRDEELANAWFERNRNEFRFERFSESKSAYLFVRRRG